MALLFTGLAIFSMSYHNGLQNWGRFAQGRLPRLLRYGQTIKERYKHSIMMQRYKIPDIITLIFDIATLNFDILLYLYIIIKSETFLRKGFIFADSHHGKGVPDYGTSQKMRFKRRKFPKWV